MSPFKLEVSLSNKITNYADEAPVGTTSAERRKKFFFFFKKKKKKKKKNAAAIMAGTLVLPSIPPFAGGLAGFGAGQVRASADISSFVPCIGLSDLKEGDGRRAQRPTGRQSLIVVSGWSCPYGFLAHDKAAGTGMTYSPFPQAAPPSFLQFAGSPVGGRAVGHEAWRSLGPRLR